jgi:Dna[CI] antecedent, DciA
MERASRLIRALRLPGDTLNLEELACAVWPTAVGRRIAVHARAVRLVRARLVVEVEDAVWRRQLFTLSGQILRNLEKSIGPGAVEDLEFRVAPRKREPQRETRAAAGEVGPQPLDEAESIPDPVLRGIYRASKKRALA